MNFLFLPLVNALRFFFFLYTTEKHCCHSFPYHIQINYRTKDVLNVKMKQIKLWYFICEEMMCLQSKYRDYNGLW